MKMSYKHFEEQLRESVTAILLKVTSYAGGVVSVVSALTLTDVGIIVGIATAILTYATNAFYKRLEIKHARLRNEREEEEHQLRMKLLLNPDRREQDIPVIHDRRVHEQNS